MPRFYFDTDDGEHALSDDEGQEMSSFQAARVEAIRVLPDIARDILPDGERRVFVSVIRDETGATLFKATLTFKCERFS